MFTALNPAKDTRDYPAYLWQAHPIFYRTNDNWILCPDCANIKGVRMGRHRRLSWDVNADEILYCSNCGGRIETVN